MFRMNMSSDNNWKLYLCDYYFDYFCMFCASAFNKHRRPTKSVCKFAQRSRRLLSQNWSISRRISFKPYWCSRLLYSYQVPTSNFIETPGCRIVSEWSHFRKLLYQSLNNLQMFKLFPFSPQKKYFRSCRLTASDHPWHTVVHPKISTWNK